MSPYRCEAAQAVGFGLIDEFSYKTKLLSQFKLLLQITTSIND